MKPAPGSILWGGFWQGDTLDQTGHNPEVDPASGKRWQRSTQVFHRWPIDGPRILGRSLEDRLAYGSTHVDQALSEIDMALLPRTLAPFHRMTRDTELGCRADPEGAVPRPDGWRQREYEVMN